VTGLPSPLRDIRVIKLGGSVLTGVPAFHTAAAFVAERQRALGSRLVVVVSAEYGQTDALLTLARDLNPHPDAHALDLLWSTGELRSVALLVLALQARGVRAAGANVHQAGINVADGIDAAGRATLQPLRLRALLAGHDVVVVPGFLARAAGDAVASLGRGGSDLTAVLIAAALDAGGCELVKDVDGYFTADPRADDRASHVPWLDFAGAIAMADAGCELVQRDALVAAAAAELPLSIRAIGGTRTTLVSSLQEAR
jgi:aspartate kinase